MFLQGAKSVLLSETDRQTEAETDRQIYQGTQPYRHLLTSARLVKKGVSCCSNFLLQTFKAPFIHMVSTTDLCVFHLLLLLKVGSGKFG